MIMSHRNGVKKLNLENIHHEAHEAHEVTAKN